MVDTTAEISRPGIEESETYRTLLDLAQRSTESPLAELLVRHVMRITHEADWPVRRAALDACLRRLDFAHRDELRVAKRPPAQRALGVYRTRRSGSRHRPYETELERLDPLVGSCECPDFLRGSLGLCKHLLAVIEDLTGRPRRFRQALDANGAPAASPRPRLVWDPIRPLTGPGDWLERLRLDDGGRRVQLTKVFATARPFFGTAGNGSLVLKDAFPGQPQRRLELVQALLPLARRAAWRQAALPPLLAAEKLRLERLLSSRAAQRRFETALRSLKRKLYPFQIEGVRLALERGALLLADDMGLGKTAQAIAVCHALWSSGMLRRGLVIAPASLKPQWLREWRLFTDAPARIVEGGPGERRAAWRKQDSGFLIANYELVLRDLEQVEAWDPGIVVLDEAQRIKNWATKTAACVKKLHPPCRLVLTGTPMENRLEELASILDWVDDMALEPKWRLVPWHTLYADGRRETVGARNLDTLRQRLAPCMLRRVRREVLKQLPPRTDTIIPVDLTESQAEEHDALIQPIAALVSITERRPLTQQEFLRLMQLLTTQRIIANGLAQLQFVEQWPRIRDTSNPSPAMLKSLDSPKLLELREILPQLAIEQERKIVVFSQWRRMLRLAHWAVEGVLSASGVRAAFFSGEESQRRRNQNLVDFHDDPDLRVLFATDAGGVGLNLQRASNCCINLELPWNPAVLEQRIGRIYRMGQEQPIDVYNLVSRNCIEERIAALVGDKKALFDGLFDGSSDEIRFERSGSFMASVRMIMKGVPVPEAGADDEGATEAGEAEQRELEAILDTADNLEPAPAQDKLVEVKPLVAAPGATFESAAALPAVETVQGLLASLAFRSSPDGRVSIDAPPEAAAGLAAVFEGLARMLRAGAEQPAPRGRLPGDYEGDPVLGRPVSDLQLSTRSANNLEYCGIHTIGALLEHSADDLLAHRGFGLSFLREVRRRLDEHGLSLRGDPRADAPLQPPRSVPRP